MTYLKNITIYNFRVFSNKVTFNFNNKRLILLTAPNGKGKTSLIDAIEWCLTGNIQRLQYAFSERNPNNTEASLKGNKQAILKNINHLRDKVEISLEIDVDGKAYTITRIQEDDTLENLGIVNVNGQKDKEAQVILDSLFQRGNYYKYHVCDMQKAYRFQRTDRSNMSTEFADFAQDHSKAEIFVENLIFFQEDIEKYIAELNQGKIDEKTLNIYKSEMKKYEQAPEILPYPPDILFDGELIINENHTEKQLKSLLDCLYNYGYSYAASILEKLSNNKKYVKIIENLSILKKEFTLHEKHIKEAVKKEAIKKSIRENAKITMESLQELQQDLKLSTLDAYSEKIVRLGNEKFKKEYLENQMKASEKTKKQISELKTSISSRKKGNDIIDILSQIAAGEKGLIEYRQKIRSEKVDKVVKCPVCGSEIFDKISNEEIVKEAKDYVNTQDNLITEEQKRLKLANQELGNIRNQTLKCAEEAVKEVEVEKENAYKVLMDLYSISKPFFNVLKKLQKSDGETYSEEKIISYSKIISLLEQNKKNILNDDVIIEYENTVRRVLILVDYSDKEKLKETELPITQLLLYIKQKSSLAPKIKSYNEKLLQVKINSIRSRILNCSYLDYSRKLKEAEKKNTSIDQSIENLRCLSTKAKTKEKAIHDYLKDMNKYEFEQVGPYLYKIFRKLSRDVSISGIKLKSGRGDDRLQLVDENEHPILNMLSEGQLSVFMLSYFFGNAFRLHEKENFGVYFVDDITNTMDDINVLAFIDLIKYQLCDSQEDLTNSNRVISQFFFATCNNSLKEMFCYKMDKCGISYKEISTDEFERNCI